MRTKDSTVPKLTLARAAQEIAYENLGHCRLLAGMIGFVRCAYTRGHMASLSDCMHPSRGPSNSTQFQFPLRSEKVTPVASVNGSAGASDGPLSTKGLSAPPTAYVASILSTTTSATPTSSTCASALPSAGAPLTEEDAEDVSEAPHVCPTVSPISMTRLRTPSSKFKSLVTILERERVLGNTRVAFSQLGSMLRAEDPAAYKRAGAKQLRDFAALAEKEGVVILGASEGDSGNRWTALHPTYHGKAPEAQTPLSHSVQLHAWTVAESIDTANR